MDKKGQKRQGYLSEGLGRLSRDRQVTKSARIGKEQKVRCPFCAKHQTLSIAGKSRERGQIQGKARCCSWPESGFDGKEGEPFFVGQIEA